MRPYVPLLAIILTGAFLIGVRAPDRRAQEVARGEYLTHHVAMCVQCHTPRMDDGTLDRDRLFQGAPVIVGPPAIPNVKWAVRAPNIAGLTGITDEEETALLTAGQRPGHPPPMLPMPPFRFTEADAKAIIAYLRSLTSRR